MLPSVRPVTPDVSMSGSDCAGAGMVVDGEPSGTTAVEKGCASTPTTVRNPPVASPLPLPGVVAPSSVLPLGRLASSPFRDALLSRFIATCVAYCAAVTCCVARGAKFGLRVDRSMWVFSSSRGGHSRRLRSSLTLVLTRGSTCMATQRGSEWMRLRTTGSYSDTVGIVACLVPRSERARGGTRVVLGSNTYALLGVDFVRTRFARFPARSAPVSTVSTLFSLSIPRLGSTCSCAGLRGNWITRIGWPR